MTDALAIWGAFTGSLATAVTLRREYLAGRRRLAVAPGCNYILTLGEAPRVSHAWAFVAIWNTGGRALAVEHVGFRYVVLDPPPDDGVQHAWEYRAEIAHNEPIDLPVDGPTVKIYTPLGPMLAAGISPATPLEAYAVTTGGRWWYSPPQPLIQSMPPGIAPDRFVEGVGALGQSSPVPDTADRIVFLQRGDPFAPAAPKDA